MENDVLKSETYKSLLSIRRQYVNLSKYSFPCKGSSTVWQLLHLLIEKLLERIDKYTTRQIRLINTLLPTFDSFCGLLDDSILDKVPWSILPSLESIFSKIRQGSEFVITPQWEVNYAVFNKNIIDYIDGKILSIPNLVFDAGPNFQENKAQFLTKFNKEVYLLLYPRGERLFVLHFPLLGHEIGHIFANEWISVNFNNKLKQLDLYNKVDNYIKQNMPADFKGSLFEPQYVINERGRIFDVFTKIMAEIISDFVGAIVFGPSALLSTFVFSLKFGYDDPSGIEHGYFPWRFRLYFLSKILNIFHTYNFPASFSGVKDWLTQINQLTNGYDYIGFLSNQTKYAFTSFLFELIDTDTKAISDELVHLVPAPHYSDVSNPSLQVEAANRLKNGIIPNCLISDDLQEMPVGFINIIVGTWLFLCEHPLDDVCKFNEISRTANLLSLKGIELSHLQQEVLARDN